MKIEIETCARLSDYWIDDNGQKRTKYHAQIKDEPAIWSCGKTPNEAVGNLINSHPERFSIKQTYLGRLPR